MSEEYIWVDKNVEAVSDKLKSRMEVGYKKYGCTTERTDLDLEQWLTHLSEELLDSSVYLERIMQELKTKRDISIANAYDAIKSHMHKDDEYAWGFHCNLAMCIYDSLKVSHYDSNKTASYIMQYFYSIDMEKNKYYNDTIMIMERLNK